MIVDPRIQLIAEAIETKLSRWFRRIRIPQLSSGEPWELLQPCPVGWGSFSPPALSRTLFMQGSGVGGGGGQKEDLEAALRFTLVLKRQCGIYLYATTKAVEFIYMDSPTMVCEDETDIHKYTGSVETLFSATFNTFNELLCRDAVHRRVGMRMTAEEYYDLNMYDRVHKLIRFIMLVFQVLCQTQTAFKNIAVPSRLETHISG